MKLSAEQKNDILKMMEENFFWCNRETFYDSSFYDEVIKYGIWEKGFEFNNGVVKYCISHPDFNGFVVKFCNYRFNYCEREYKNYLAAVEKGIEEFFPYTDFLGTMNGIDLYIQEKAVCDSDGVSSIWYHAIEEDYVNVYNESEDIVYGRIWDMISDLEDDQRAIYCFGYNEKLLNFLGEYRINDLHEGNFGYTEDRLVIIDFSGFGAAVEKLGL